MAEPEDIEFRILLVQDVIYFSQKIGDAGDRYWNIVFVRLIPGDRFGNVFAQTPQLTRLGFRFANDAIVNPAAVCAMLIEFKRRFQRGIGGFIEFDKHVEFACLLEWAVQAMSANILQAFFGKKFKSTELQWLLRLSINFHHCVALADGEHHDAGFLRRPGEFDCRFND